ncbi:MAG: GNAT family N-acetyltransferase [Steroidobacteraceae bacterium]
MSAQDPATQAPENGPDNATRWQRRWCGGDGAEYRFRPIRPDDSARELAFILGLSEEARYNRMLGMIRTPSARLIEQFVHVDYQHDMAFVAVSGCDVAERIVGVARYASTAPETRCEFAVAVTDTCQGHGMGRALMGVLMDYARQAGMRELYGLVFAHNQRMLALAHALGMSARPCELDPTLVEVSRRL